MYQKRQGVKQTLPYTLGLACFFPQLTTWKGQDRMDGQSIRKYLRTLQCKTKGICWSALWRFLLYHLKESPLNGSLGSSGKHRCNQRTHWWLRKVCKPKAFEMTNMWRINITKREIINQKQSLRPSCVLNKSSFTWPLPTCMLSGSFSATHPCSRPQENLLLQEKVLLPGPFQGFNLKWSPSSQSGEYRDAPLPVRFLWKKGDITCQMPLPLLGFVLDGYLVNPCTDHLNYIEGLGRMPSLRIWFGLK